MTDINYWLWYVLATGTRKAFARDLYKKVGDIEKLYKYGKNDYAKLGITDAETLNMLCNKDMSMVEREIWFAKNYNVWFIAVDDERYPPLLKNIYDSPLVLYIRGDHFNPKDELYIAVVGTRRASRYGRDAALKLCYDLASHGITVVSGMAEGIDSYAHIGCLDAGGKTIAVLGTGVNQVYPKINKDLMHRIVNNGCAISEYSFDSKSYPGNFPARNRIISGLCMGTVVIEASEKSGSLITANFALDQNRDVFAVPGNINNPTSSGVNTLIKNNAKMVTCARDIIEEYENVYPDLIRHDVITKKSIEFEIPESQNFLNKESLDILNCVKDIPKGIDQIAIECKLPIAQLNGIITLLELDDKIKKIPGELYAKK